jgi:hypothetical protein
MNEVAGVDAAKAFSTSPRNIQRHRDELKTKRRGISLAPLSADRQTAIGKSEPKYFPQRLNNIERAGMFSGNKFIRPRPHVPKPH